MFNITTELAANKYQLYLLRLMESFERKARPKWLALLQETFRRAGKLVEHSINDMSGLFTEHRKAVQQRLLIDYKDALSYFGTFTFDQFNKQYKKGIIGPSHIKSMEDVYWEEVRRWASHSALAKSILIEDSTKAMINKIVSSGMREGLSNSDIAKQLMEGKADFNKVRAMRIVRTETHSAANKAINESVKATGFPHVRVWRATLDDRVRGRSPKDRFNHLKANRQIRDLDVPFDVSGEKLDFPGDPKGKPGNIINCIISPKAPIFTSEGWRQINQIVPGDMVLTHKNRFRRVLRLSRSKYSGEFIQFSVCDFKRREGSVAVTPEHPFLVNDKWIQAKDLQIGDKIQTMAAFCSYCGRAIPWWLHYCNRTCLSKHITKKQWADPEHRKNMSEKISITNKQQYADGIRDRYKQTKKALKSSKKKYGDGGFLHWVKNNDPDKYIQMRQSRIKAIEDKYGSIANMINGAAKSMLSKAAKKGETKIEVAMARFLEKKRKAFKQQFIVGRRRIDFYVPEDKLFIECDGFPWHEDKVRERKRDYEILMQYPDHTIAHVDYKPNPPHWEKWTLVDLMQLNHDGVYVQIPMPVVAIEKKQAKQGKGLSKTVYNFAVEEDESYIVNGLVSHNCRCVTTYSTKRSTYRGFDNQSGFDNIPMAGKFPDDFPPASKEPMSSVGRLSNCIIRSGKQVDLKAKKPRGDGLIGGLDPCIDYVRINGEWFLKGEKVIDEEELTRLNSISIPPGWNNVVAATNKNARTQAIGKDRAGRWQYRFSAEHREESAIEKFNRQKLFSKVMPDVRKAIDRDLEWEVKEAYLLKMEDLTAVRVGSKKDFKAKVKAYGLTTLQNEHVRIEGSKIFLDFIAKEGIPAHYEIDNAKIAGWLLKRKENTKVGEMLFPDIQAPKLNKYLKKISGNKEFMMKDFRTYHGTRIAFEELKQYAGKVLTDAEKKAIVKEVCEKASVFLANTPAMAKSSYINPMVWDIIGGL